MYVGGEALCTVGASCSGCKTIDRLGTAFKALITDSSCGMQDWERGQALVMSVEEICGVRLRRVEIQTSRTCGSRSNGCTFPSCVCGRRVPLTGQLPSAQSSELQCLGPLSCDVPTRDTMLGYAGLPERASAHQAHRGLVWNAL